MPDAPLVSICIPTYNRAGTLPRAIDSALAQDYPSIELIVVDNGSSDATQTICSEYRMRDSRVSYVRHPNNIGPTANFIAAERLARGEFFMWLADDDWIDPNYVRSCVDELSRDSGLALVAGISSHYDDGRVRRSAPMNLSSAGAARRVLKYYATVSHNSVFYGVIRRTAGSQIVLRNALANDWLLIARLSFIGRIRTLLHTQIHRELSGTGSSPGRIARTLNLPAVHGYFPVWFTGFNAFAEIAWRDDLYRGLSGSRRWLLGALVFVVVLIHKGVYFRIRSALVGAARKILGANRYESCKERLRAVDANTPSKAAKPGG
jgi:glycosyltransferase involved in cell wall biosynthesis